MATRETYSNFSQLWADLLEERANDDAIRIPGRDEGTYVNFKVKSLGNRAARLADAFRVELKLVTGDAIAVLADAPQEFPLLFHGAMLAQVVFVPLRVSMGDELLAALINNCNVKAVVFPPELAARVAGLFGRTPYVAHWIVTGGGMRFSGGASIKRLDDIMIAGAGARVEAPETIDGEIPGVLMVSPENGKGVMLSQSAVLHAGQALGSYLRRDEGSIANTVSFISNRRIVGLVHDLVQGLFSGTPAVVAPDFDAGRFWDTVMVAGGQDAIINLEQLRQVNKRGRGRGQVVPQKLKLIVVSSRVLSSELLESFEKRFGFAVTTSYGVTEAGGLVTVFPSDLDAAESRRFYSQYAVPSSGTAVPGIEFRIVDQSGEELPDAEVGEIIIRGPQVMSAYHGSGPGTAFFGLENCLHTGDEGFVVHDSKKRAHLFVIGRIAEMVDIEGARTNPLAIENYLLELRGIEQVVATPIYTFGGDVRLGVAVIQSRMATYTEESIIEALRGKFQPEELPTVVEVVTTDGRAEVLNRAQVQKRLSARVGTR